MDIIGEKFNNWKILEILSDKECLCECQCDKKTTKVIPIYNVLSGRSKSCGCTRYSNKKKDLVGEHFGDWEVVKMLPNRKCLCRCICGFEKEQYHSNLTNAKTEYKCRHVGEVGKQFGNWVVLKELGGGKVLCECQCKNKTVKELYKKAVLSGETRSCGCMSKQFERETKGFDNLEGKQFGEWRVISFNGNSTWLCECSCKNKTRRVVTKEALVNGRSKSCGCKQGEHIKETIETVYNGIYPQNVDYESKLQSHVTEYIESIYKGVIETSNRTVIRPQEIDIYLPEFNIGIEVNGSFWHSDAFKDKDYHKDKSIECMKNGTHLIHIFEYEWVNSNDIIKKFLKNTICSGNKIYARDTVISVVNDNIAKIFINKYHLQGYARADINICLQYNDEIVAMMTFGKPRFSSDYQYELIRLCFKDGVSIIGGAEKLFKFFISNHDVHSIISYCDIAKFSGNVYKKLGFKLDGVSQPSYVWAKGNDIKTRFQTQKKRLVKAGLGTEDQTEVEIMNGLGYHRIYDCGNYRFTWNKEGNK